MKPCGREDCYCTTHVGDELSFGRGGEFYGFWDEPCGICARDAEVRHGRPVGTYWPPPQLQPLPQTQETLR